MYSGSNFKKGFGLLLMGRKKYFTIFLDFPIETIPFQTVDIGDADALAEGDDQQWDVARKIIEKYENIIPGAVSEDHTDATTYATQYALEGKEILLNKQSFHQIIR